MRRDGVLLLVAVLALSGALVAAFGTLTERDVALHGYRNPVVDTDIPFALPRLGVNVDLTQYSGQALREQLRLMQNAGFVWIRQPLDWSEFAGDSSGGRYQPIFAALMEQPTLRLIAALSDSTGTPPDTELFTQAAANLARNYGDSIAIYEIWNEPNLGVMWGGSPSPAAYAALLNASYRAIHAQDSSALVNSAALAPTTETRPQNMSDLVYLEALYSLGLRDFSDGISAKPYGFSDSPTAAAEQQTLNFRRVTLLRDIMLRHDDAHTPLWASEWGWNSLPDDWRGQASIWGGVTPEEQAGYTLETLSLVETRYPWLGGMILCCWQPLELPPEDGRWGFAIRDIQGSASPLWSAFVAARSQLNAAPQGLHRPDNPFARYSGVWSFGELGADIGWVGDSSLEFTFQGDALSLLVREGNYTAHLYATIDGQPANALPRDNNGNAYLLLTSDTLTPQVQLVPIAQHLGEGPHTLRIVAERGWDQWALVGFAVGGSDLAAPYNRQIVLAIISAIIATGSVMIFARRIKWGNATQPVRSAFKHISNLGVLTLSGLAAVVMMLGMLLTWRNGLPDILRREPVQLGVALLTGGLVYLNPAFIVSLAASAVLFIIFFHKPLIGLTLTLFFAPFYLFPVELYRFAFPMSELLILLTFGAWLIRVGVHWAQNRSTPTHSDQPLKWHSVDLLLVAYIGFGVLSLAWTEYRSPAITELRTLFAEPLMFYIVLRTSRPTPRDILRLVDTLVISAALVASIGLFLYLRGDAIITAEDGVRRLASVYGSPNNVALSLGRALPFALAFLLIRLDRRRQVVMAILLLIMTTALILTLSAGAFFFGIPAALVVVVVLTFRSRSTLPLLSLGLLGGIALPILAQFPRFARLLEPTEGTNFFRIRVWQSAIAMIRDHPVTGIGQDQFLPYFQGRYILPDAWQEPQLSHPHNFLLDIWLRLGMGGVIWLGAILFVLIRSLLRTYHRFHDQPGEGKWVTAICVGSLGALANVVAHGLIDNSLFVNDLIYAFVLICGIASSIDQQP